MHSKSKFSVQSYKQHILDEAISCREVHKLSDWMRSPSSRAVVLRHDVDRHFRNAVEMAKVENESGVSAVYYFRCIRGRFPESEIEQIRNLGHEVGYHYEVLSKTNGDIKKGIDLFAAELAKLRALAPVETASMHGSPLSPHDSRLIWDATTPEHFDLLGEAYISIDYSEVIYLTDTGRSWREDSVNLRDKVDSNSPVCRVESIEEISGLFEARDETIIISVHPERWAYNNSTWMRSFSEDLASNSIKSLIRRIR